MPARRLVFALFAALFAAAPATAGDVPVDLELVLAVDASRSIDEEEWQLQRQGYVTALSDPQVIEAVRSGPLGAIAIAYVEWSGTGEQATVVGWRLIRDVASATAFADELSGQPRRFMGATSISGGVDYAVTLFEDNGFDGTRKTIDVSGDGVNNRGRTADAARDDAVAKGVTINALAIINDRPSRRWNEGPLDEFMRDHVIGGPGAFIMVVKDFASFAEAIRRKLIQEIAWRAPPAATFAANDASAY